MRLCIKVVVTTQQRLAIARASAPTIGTHPNAMLLKFAMSEDYQVVLQERKGLAGTKLGPDKDLMPT